MSAMLLLLWKRLVTYRAARRWTGSSLGSKRPVTLDILRFWRVVSVAYLSGALATLGCSVF